MKNRASHRLILSALLMAICGLPSSVWACAACFGASDSKLAIGMNWGIFSLLIVVVGVLGTIATFFVYLAKRAAMFPANAPGEMSTANNQA